MPAVHSKPRQLKVLSLDGGGVRGLSSLLILKRIMATVGAKTKRKDLQPYQYFDLIGGTSTGGIIALMLGRMRMSIDDCIAEYQRLGRIVFEKPKGPLHEFMFDQAVLTRETKAVVERYLGNEDAPLLDPLGDDACKTVIYTLPYKSVGSQTATALRTYINEDRDPAPKPWTIWEAVRATSAALTIFEPFEHGPPGQMIRYVDAGFGYNNPSDEVVHEVKSLWGSDDPLDLNTHIGVFLSLGTGMGDVVRLDDHTVVQKLSAKVRKPLAAVEAMKSIITGTERTHRNVAEQFGVRSTRYHRFNVDQGLQDVELFDHKKREEMEVDTLTYLDKFQVGKDLKQCVALMKDIPVDRPDLLANRNNEMEVYSLGEDGTPEDDRLRERLAALKINDECFKRHHKDWEAMREGATSRYHKQLYDQIAHMSYIWNAVVQADLLDERGRNIARYCSPNPDRPQLIVDDKCKHVAYYTETDTPARKAARLGLANEDLANAFGIYRQLLHTAESTWAMFGPDCFVYCWVAKRLGALLEYWGQSREARNLYLVARDGKASLFGKDHWSVQWLQKKTEQLTYELRE
ncbi:acyl transferase/acyl hydrolase/lysophospholipase [Podospora didyma]|uniref:Acyl transferase/acyl hydrolase/lysophospholipase n=1 Tax=Podospora didyma TaxID=330526 RepID=A0AAE0K4K0_9PEZI|nr:acyl transferase/acyl hydrolase/lysophospholipase [Podospora didyma]